MAEPWQGARASFPLPWHGRGGGCCWQGRRDLADSGRDWVLCGPDMPCRREAEPCTPPTQPGLGPPRLWVGCAGAGGAAPHAALLPLPPPVYLLLGLLAMLLLLQTFHQAAALYGLSDLILLPPEGQERILESQDPPTEGGLAEEKAPVSTPLSARGLANYSSINR